MQRLAFVRVLQIAAFRNLWLSQAISQIFLNLLMFSLIIRVYEITRSNAPVSVVVITTILPNIFLGALAGVLVDRWNRKMVMFFSHFLRVLAVLMFLVSSESLIWIYLMTIIIGTITQFFLPAEGATIPELVREPKLLLTANSVFTLTFFSSVVIGNVLAGPFLQILGPKMTFVLVALAFLLASIFTSRLPGEGLVEAIVNNRHAEFLRSLRHLRLDQAKGGIFENFMEGIDHIYRTPKVRLGIYYMAVGQGMIAILGSIAPGFADRILHLPVASVSVIVMAPAALGMIVGAGTVGQFFHGHSREKLIGFGFVSASLVLLAFSQVDNFSAVFAVPVILLALVVLFTLGVANAFLEVPINTLIQENTPLSVRSRVYGVISTVVGLAAVLPVVLAGTAADLLGVRVVMFACGLILLLLAISNGRSLNLLNFRKREGLVSV